MRVVARAEVARREGRRVKPVDVRGWGGSGAGPRIREHGGKVIGLASRGKNTGQMDFGAVWAQKLKSV